MGVFVPCVVLSCHVLSCLGLCCHALSCLVLCALVLLFIVVSCLGLSCLGLSCLVLSCQRSSSLNWFSHVHTFNAALVSACASCSFTSAFCNACLLPLALRLRPSCSLRVYDATATKDTIRCQKTYGQNTQVCLPHGVLPRGFLTPSPPLPAIPPTTKRPPPTRYSFSPLVVSLLLCLLPSSPTL